MSTTNNEIRTTQEASWNKFSPGWKKWDTHFMAFLAPHADAIIAHLKPGGDDVVLDIAAGTGEPGLSMARMLSGGKVVMADLSDGMLQVAREKVAAAGVTNVEFQAADACELPFEDNSFDAVSCRLGFMFFPDMELAVQEMTRVLKPGGKLAITVWGPPENNFWITCMMQNIKKRIDVPALAPGAPDMFRCAQPGLMSGIFTAAGLKEASEREVPSKMECSNGEGYWNMITEVAAPFVDELSTADEATVAAIKMAVVAGMNERFPDGSIDGWGTLIVGVK